jgi:glycerol transport system ATP-binding protein
MYRGEQMSIRLENLTKSFGANLVLDNISLQIKNGDFVSFLAPTGSGKTTLLRIMAGLDKPNKGKIFYDEKDVTDLSVRERNIAMVYQDFINYPSLTVYENIASPLRLNRSLSEEEIDKKVKENADLLGLLDVLEKYPEELSGGQRQRTAIARSLVKDVEHIFLDEPLANLDYKLREELRGQLKETFKSEKGAIIYATADPLDALVLSTHVGYLNNGKILQYGPVEEVYNKPKYVEVAQYFSSPTTNILEADLVKEKDNLYLKVYDEFKIDVTKFADLLNNDHYLTGIKCQSLNTSKQNSNDILIKAEIELNEVVGSDTELHLKYKDLELVMLMQTIINHQIGEVIDVFINPNDIFIFDKESRELITSTGGER